MEFISKSLNDTYNFAKEISKQIKVPYIIALNGDLGAGKTVFVKFLAEILKITSIVTSPTFTLMNEYDEGIYPLYHFDMYRIEHSDDVLELGFEEYFNSKKAVIVIEWPDVVRNILPKTDLDIFIEKIDENTRKFIIKKWIWNY